VSGSRIRTEVFFDFEAPDGDSLGAFRCVFDNEAHALPLLEVAIPFPFDTGEMDEDLFFILVRCDEPIPFDPTEPLD
jgi:hypothetical protein